MQHAVFLRKKTTLVTEEFLKRNEDFDSVGWKGCFSARVERVGSWLEESGRGALYCIVLPFKI